MYDRQDDPVVEPLETIHLYVVREGQARPSLLPVLISVVALSLLVAIGILVPYEQPEQRALIRVPAVLLPLRTFMTSVRVMPTGVRTFPATRATGVLIITNGSILAQHLLAGMIFTTANGSEVVTTTSVDVPASNGVSFGVASVSAQAVTPGTSGNLAPLAIDAVYGTSLYIKNEQAFRGGNNSYSIPVIQPTDIQHALTQARASLFQHTLTGLLERPCAEHVAGSATLTITWTCQFVSYQVTGQVLSARVQGRSIIVEVLRVAPKQIIQTK